MIPVERGPVLQSNLELNFRFEKSRIWKEFLSERWKLKGLKHRVQPYANYAYIPEPNIENDKLFFFDEIDRVDRLNFLRLGARHQFQSKRNNKVYTFARLEEFC